MHKKIVALSMIAFAIHAADLIPPKLISVSTPKYPVSQKASGVEGNVILTLLVNETGAVESVTVSKTINPTFDSLAVQSARKLQFTPATMEGVAVATELPYLVSFSLKEDLEKLHSEVRISGVLTRMGSTETLNNRVIRYIPQDAVLFNLPKNRVLDQLGTFFHQSRDNNSLITKTDSLGQFAFRGVPDGKFTILVETDLYKPFEVKDSLAPDTRRTLDLVAEPIGYNQYEVVSTYRGSDHVSTYSITSEQIAHTAGTSGDPIRALQTLPSVSRTSRSSQPVIRGARPEDSQLYFDGMELPYMFHNNGFKSVIPGSVLSNISLFPSGYGAYYGNSIGGVVSAQSDTIPLKKINANIDISTLDMGGFFDANLVKELRLSAGGRISERFGLMKRYVQETEGNKGLIPSYADYFGKLQYLLLDRNHLDVTFIGSNDLLTTPKKERWDPREYKSFNRVSFGWVRDRKNNYSHQCYFGYSYNGVETDSTELFVRNQRYNIYTKKYLFRTKFNWFASKKLTISSGLHLTTNQVQEGAEWYYVATDTSKDTIKSATAYSHDFEVSPWVEAVYEPTKNWHIQLGGRYDYSNRADLIGSWYPTFTPGMEKRTHHAGDPSIRTSVWYQINPKQRVKFGVGNYNQIPHQVISSYEDKFVTHVIPTSKAAHYTTGYELQLTEKLGLDVQAYYNQRWNLPFLRYPTIRDSSQVQLYTGEGSSKGIELLLRQARSEHFEGWLSYSLSKSVEKTLGDYHVTNSDQTHNLQAVGTFYLPKKWEIGSRFLYTTGNPYTPIDKVYQKINKKGSTYYDASMGEVNSIRFDPAVQLNLRVSKTVTAKRTSTEIYLDLGNILYPLTRVPEKLKFDESTGTVSKYYEPPIPALGVKVTF